MKILKKILKGLGLLLAAIIVLPVVAGLILKVTSPTIAPPGQMVDVGGYKLHLNCIGPDNDLPTVMIVSGAGTPSYGYHWLQDNLGETNRTCVFDRPGLAWSETSEKPIGAITAAEDMKALMDAADIRRPVIFAGHSIAGPYMRLFTDRYPDDVAGIVFIDSSHPEQEERMAMPEEALETLQFIVSLTQKASHIGLTHLFNPLEFGVDMSAFPDDIQKQHKYIINSPDHIAGGLAEQNSVAASLGEARHTSSLGDLPIAVLTAGKEMPAELFPEGFDVKKMQQTWFELQREIAALSSNSEHVIMDGANHGSIVSEKRYADQVADYVRGVIEKAEIRRSAYVEKQVNGSKTGEENE